MVGVGDSRADPESATCCNLGNVDWSVLVPSTPFHVPGPRVTVLCHDEWTAGPNICVIRTDIGLNVDGRRWIDRRGEGERR